LYADERLGFSEAELMELLEKAGFRSVTTSIVDRETEPPQFQTLLAIGEKAPAAPFGPAGASAKPRP
jgi:ArsR family transcriptional regulator